MSASIRGGRWRRPRARSCEALRWEGRADQALRVAIHFGLIDPEDGRRHGHSHTGARPATGADRTRRRATGLRRDVRRPC
jgi:hypothetical protein